MARVLSGSRRSVSREARKAVQVEGMDEIQVRLGTIIDGVTGKEAKEVYHKAGTILRDQARHNAPYDPNRKKGTHLRDAIFVNWGDDSKSNVLVGVRYKAPGAPHAHLLEYGTSRMPARPYFRPAIVQAGPQVASTIKDGLLGIIERHAKK